MTCARDKLTRPLITAFVLAAGLALLNAGCIGSMPSPEDEEPPAPEEEREPAAVERDEPEPVPEADGPLSLEQEAAARKLAAGRRRRIIFNNDGGDARVRREPIDVPEMLEPRTKPLVATQVDTILYDTTAGTFGCFAHRSNVAEVFLTREDRYRHNITPDLVARGTDPLEVMISFARDNDFEIFWTMRMNDTHDAGNALLRSEFKQRHPEMLLGSSGSRPAHGAWTGVDYEHRLVREMAYRYIAEVADNYDVDGIHLDFFRHPAFFGRVARGGEATDAERELMTDLLRRVRRHIRERGAQRGRPLLLAVRTPDCPRYSRRIGLDIERWMEEGLIDLHFPAGYFRLRPLSDSVELAHRHGIKVYPDMSEPRVNDWRSSGREPDRRTLEAYRGRAANAWHAGANGLHLFNMFRADHPMLREIGDPHTLAGRNKFYFVNVRGVAGSADPERYLSGGRRFVDIPVLNPDTPLSLDGREGNDSFLITVGEDLTAGRAAGLRPQAVLQLVAEGLGEGEKCRVLVNGRPAEFAGREGAVLKFAVPIENIRRGDNRIQVAAGQGPRSRMVWSRQSPPEENGLNLTHVMASIPDPNILRLCLAGESRGDAVLGSFTIRTARRAGGDAPPGFETRPNGFAYPAGWTHPGYIDNGPADENPADGIFCISIPVPPEKEGVYDLLVGVQNRPAPGDYTRCDRIVRIRLDEKGRLSLPATLRDARLEIRWEEP